MGVDKLILVPFPAHFNIVTGCYHATFHCSLFSSVSVTSNVIHQGKKKGKGIGNGVNHLFLAGLPTFKKDAYACYFWFKKDLIHCHSI